MPTDYQRLEQRVKELTEALREIRGICEPLIYPYDTPPGISDIDERAAAALGHPEHTASSAHEPSEDQYLARLRLEFSDDADAHCPGTDLPCIHALAWIHPCDRDVDGTYECEAARRD